MQKELFDKIVAALLPEMEDASARKSLVESALYECPVLQKIQWDGAARPFTVQLVRLLDQFGEVAQGRPAVVAVLEEARAQVGVERQGQIDGLLAQFKTPTTKPSSQETTQPPPRTFTEGELYIFISYARPDRAVAEQVESFLTAAGVRVFRDTSDIRAGDNWDLKIEEALRECQCMVLLLSSSSMPDRKEVHREWFRFDQKGKTIYPLYIQECELHSRFDSRNYIDARSNLQAALERLLKDLRRDFPVPEPTLVANLKIPASAQRNLEVAYLERLRSEELRNSERYTPMSGASHQKRAQMRAVFELLPMGNDRSLPRKSKRFENAVEEIRRIRRAVLLGEPGGGKTTTIWKLAADLVVTALQDREAPIPLLIPLGYWTDDDQPLSAFIASQLGDLGESLDLLLGEKRAALLLDGLNELPAGQRDLKYPQVKQLIEQHPALMAVVSCRELDYTVDLGFDRINITPLDPIRIREFTGHYLGEEIGEALFWKLAGEVAKGTHQQFMQAIGSKLTNPERIFWIESYIPEGIQDASWGWSKEEDWYWQRWIENREMPSSLMVLARNPYMLLMLTSVYAEQNELPDNRGELFRLFVETLLARERITEVEKEQLTDGLAKVAYEMQIRRGEGDEVNALTALPAANTHYLLDQRGRYLAGSANILAVGEQLRFTHQLLQEYFAARYMDLEIRAGRLKATEIWPPDQWWERTNWEEAAILLAGLYSDDCSRIVEWVAEANPEVAAMCIVRSGAGLAIATAERLRTKWIPRLTDMKGHPQPEARAAVGRALGMARLDNRQGVGTVVDKHGITLPDIDWVEIPAGEFQYGDESEWAAKPQKLSLPAFHISRYPVTYAQFQAFLDDPEGFADPRWFEGMAAKDEDRPLGEQAFKFANHPRETVSWYQAMAFCRWFSWRLGGGHDLKKVAEWAVRLPTEFEWEKAARGTDGRIYPYEGDFDSAKGNTDETGLQQTNAVGIFPNGRSPYGVMDMSGNVWEWCWSNYDKPAPDARKENLRTDKNRVLRGGSWLNSPDYARAVFRSSPPPASRYHDIGFRLVCCVRPPSLSGL